MGRIIHKTNVFTLMKSEVGAKKKTYYILMNRGVTKTKIINELKTILSKLKADCEDNKENE